MNIKFLEYNGDWDRDVKDDNGNIIEEVNWFYHKILLDGEEIDYYVWRSEYFDEDGDSKGDDIHIYGDFKGYEKCDDRIDVELIINLHQNVEEVLDDMWYVENINKEELYSLEFEL
jgi:hypothetical protein